MFCTVRFFSCFFASKFCIRKPRWRQACLLPGFISCHMTLVYEAWLLRACTLDNLGIYWTVHRKKRFTGFPSPAGMSLTKLPLGRNNSVMTSLFPPRESLVVTSRLGTGNSRTFFYGVHHCRAYTLPCIHFAMHTLCREYSLPCIHSAVHTLIYKKIANFF